MRHVLAGLLSVMLIATALPGSAQNSAIEDVISEQIDALKSDDFARAFTFASPFIQNMFQTPERFGRMVREGYPMVWRPAEVTFLDSREEGKVVWQRVQVRDGSGQMHWLGYQMTQTPSGWKINGVVQLKAPDVGV